MRRLRLITVAGLSAAAFAAIPACVANVANAATTTRYVSPSGSGTACTAKAPCSLATAQSEVRIAARAMSGDQVVQLAGGTYPAPLTFNASDSGTGGHVVRYQGAPGERAVISGGRTITGWSIQDAGKNIWQASVPVGFTGRQLYVNGVRARIAWGRTSDVLGSLTATPSGYRATNPAVSTWTRPQDTEFVYPAGGHDPAPGATQANPFSWSMCSVNSVSGTTITMESACFRNGRGMVPQQDRQPPAPVPATITVPTYVQNNYALLSEPGEFYLDSAQGKLYYIPRAGEHLPSATVVLAHEQNLLTATGTAGAPVHDLQFTGLTFEYGTYLPDKQLGVLDFEGNLLANAANWQEDEPSELKMLPSDVSFRHAQRVLFQNNVLTHLGGGGISFSGGGSANSVVGNVVTDVSSSGITIGDMIGIQTPSSYESATVSNNYVHDVAVEYEGGAGIIVGWAQHTSVTHNEVSDVGFAGIQLGSASMRTDTLAGDNHIDYNYVHDVHSSSLVDGGAIYTTGWQTSSPGSTITHNFISGDANIYGAIYLDGVSAYWQVNNNVVQHVANTSGWLFMQNLPLGNGLSDTATHNVVTDNYADTTRRFASTGGDDPSNTVTNNQLGLTSWPSAAQSIIAAAGLSSRWQAIRGGPSIVNLAYKAPVVASSNAASAGAADDGDTRTSWTSAAGDSAPAWEADLGAAKRLVKIKILTRQDVDQPSAQHNFQVWVSNTAVMSSSSALACTQGADRLPYRATFTCNLPAGPWRYVALFKTDHVAYSVAEVQVFGHS